ncbi:MAG: methyltransferase domain-containing protein [Dehalococcoidales bacterium]|jgi:hypothetical protein
MRQVVVSDDYREVEIWPQDSFNRYLKITEEEVERLFIDHGNLVAVNCPACNSDRNEPQFKKFGLQYVECLDCQTLYINPRPSEENLYRYFKESKAVEFWRTQVVQDSLKARIRYLFKPRAMWVANLAREFLESPDTLVDVNSMYEEFLSEIDSLNIFNTRLTINPMPGVTASLKDRFKVVDRPITSITPGEINADVITAFAVINRVFNPENFLRGIRNILRDKGMLFFTISTISGFDLQTLWENARTIFPPESLNLPSIEGMGKLLARCGFEVIELSTPGQLDLEVVKNTLRSNEKIKSPRFISYLINHRGEDAHHAFQEFLQRFQLSSHVRVAARKR